MATATVLKTAEPPASRVPGLGDSTPSPSAYACPWPSGKGASLPSWRGGFNSHRALALQASGDRLMASHLPLKQIMRVQLLLPELHSDQLRQRVQCDPGQLLLVVTPGSEPGRRWFDSNPRSCWQSITRKSSDRMRSLSRKQVAAKAPFVGSSPTASAAINSHRPVVQRQRLIGDPRQQRFITSDASGISFFDGVEWQ